MKNLYCIEEYVTTGWEKLDRTMTREDCSKKLQGYISSGHNPKHIRASLENDNMNQIS